MKLTKLLSLLFISFSPLFCLSQLKYQVDLSEHEGETISINVPSNEILSFEIINKLPNEEYEYSIEVNNLEMAPFSTDIFTSSIADQTALSGECDNLESQLDQLIAETDEAKIPEILSQILIELEQIKKELVKSEPTAPDKCTSSHFSKANELIQKTKELLKYSPVLKANQELKITIRNSAGTKEWTRKYKTQRKGKWITTYGFTFITGWFNKPNKYFSEEYSNEDESITGYMIDKEYQRKKLEFVPTIFFTWVPTKKLNKDLSINVTAGLGFDLEAPTAFLGGSFLWNQNISLTAGIAAHKQDFLDGKYEEGQIILESLDEGQLHESLYTFNPFISLTFRFDKNIFSKKEDTEVEQEN